MGSDFFRKTANPINSIDPGALFATFGNNKNSVLARMSYYDPVVNSGVGKVIAPAEYSAGQQYGAAHAIGPGTPGPYAGVAPTLSDANAQYIRAAQGATQQPPRAIAPAPPPPQVQANPVSLGARAWAQSNGVWG